MAWERSFEKRVLKIRDRELHWQKMTFAIQVHMCLIVIEYECLMLCLPITRYP
jgi:hypothetical protein